MSPIQPNFSQQLQPQQQQRLTLQMRQNIEFFNLPTDELTRYLEQATWDNPFLELMPPVWMQAQAQDSPDSLAWLDNYQPPLPWRQQLVQQVRLQYRHTPLTQLLLGLIEQVNDEGFLPIEPKTLAIQHQVSLTMVRDALTLLQALEPQGIGARNAYDYLTFQLQQLTGVPPCAFYLLSVAPHRLALQQWDSLAAECDSSPAEIIRAWDLLRQLKPTPLAGSTNNSPTNWLIPELEVTLQDDHLHVALLPLNLPHISFNDAYYQTLKAHADSSLRAYLTAQRQHYHHLTTALTQREAFLLQLGTLIVHHQHLYLTHQRSTPAPLLLREAATALHVSEATISRLVHQKALLNLDHQTLALRDLFSVRDEAVPNSNHHIKQHLLALIQQENPQHPLSDQQLATELQHQGLTVARRTVAKYRQALAIPVASHRRRL